MNWHNVNIEEIFELTGSSPKGLSLLTAEQKLLEYGLNQLQEQSKKPAWKLLLNQFTDVMILILLAAAIVSGIIGDVIDTIIILIIVVLNAILGFVQEYRAERAIETLKKLGALNAIVLRDNKISSISAESLVPGDVVQLEAGNIVPADIRLFEAHGVKTDESSLTGESVSVDKIANTLSDKELILGDRTNMLYKTTLLTSGRAKGIVVSTGMNTEIGLIARMLEQKESQSPLQIRMTDFARKLSYLILIICTLLFGIGILRGEEKLHMLLLAISLAVAAIPEALPALITIALAQGAKRMIKGNALIRKLHAVETLGSVNFICSDKTGTLTQNKMKVMAIEVNDNSAEIIADFSTLELLMALSHDANYSENKIWKGDPTEIALVEYIADKHSKEAIHFLQNKFKRIAEIPFDSDRKCMTTVHEYDNKYLIISKGAAESIADLVLSEDQKITILTKANKLAQEGKRVIVYGYRMVNDLPQPFNYGSIEKDLIYSGMAGMIDPPRPEVKKSIDECKSAGIHPVMITGDHPATAAAIAKDLGILLPEHLVITGRELKEITAEEFNDKVEKIRVYARVTPEQKLNIINALQRKKHFVAMTGDGVNDAPSLKSANIGVAMGISGSDVSKEAAHMILLDDNFASIVKAIKEGRRIYDNIRKFIKYIMTCNGAEIWTIFLAPLLGLPMPLLPIHILWINLVTDGLPGLAIANEKAEKNIMIRTPRKANESIFSDGVGIHIIWVGLLMAGITIGSEAWAYHTGNANWQTIVFTVLTFAQIGHVLAIRSESEYLYQQGIFTNMTLFGAVVLTFFIHLIIIYLPLANTIFNTKPLSFYELICCIGVAAIVFYAVELEKLLRKKIN